MPNTKLAHKIFVGYLVPNVIIDRLQAKGWRIAHNTPTSLEWRKQDDVGAWTIVQGSAIWDEDFAEASEGVEI